MPEQAKRRRARISLRAFIVTAVTCSLLIGFWIRWPVATAEAMLVAIRSDDYVAIDRLLGGANDEGLVNLLASNPETRDKRRMKLEPRSIREVFVGHQRILISGYGGAHRCTAIRGDITGIYYVFISGTVEYTR